MAAVLRRSSNSNFDDKRWIKANMHFGWVTARIRGYTSVANGEIRTTVNMTVNPQCGSTFHNERFEVRCVRGIQLIVLKP